MKKNTEGDRKETGGTVESRSRKGQQEPKKLIQEREQKTKTKKVNSSEGAKKSEGLVQKSLLSAEKPVESGEVC